MDSREARALIGVVTLVAGLSGLGAVAFFGLLPVFFGCAGVTAAGLLALGMSR